LTDFKYEETIITGTGMTMVHNTFLITAASKDRDDIRMLVPTMSTVMMERGAREEVSF